jgi:XTP/dITP diphosphohydrolase
MSIVVATRNLGKLDEIRQILGPHVPLTSLQDFPDIPEIVEDGDTYEANACKKAVSVARATGRAAIADDSGLEVDALGGAPGVRSARFAGEQATDDDNNAKLLGLLEGKKKRTARFRCVIAVATPEGTVRTVQGDSAGLILEAPRGSRGFGYDPLFLVPEKNQTFAELPPEEKHLISHRGRALRAARPLILQLTSS